jgi:hypothetical protein
LGYIVLDGTYVVSPIQYSVPVQMATDVSKDHAANIFTPKAPKTGQRWRSELLNATTEGSDVSSSSQQEVYRRYVWLVGILRQGA